MISSLQNDRVKLANALQNRARTRRKEGKIALEGVRLVRDAVTTGHVPDFVLHSADLDGDPLLDLVRESGSPTLPVTDAVMKHVTDTQQPQGVVAVFPKPSPKPPEQPSRLLILDGLQDPGNLGTILRTAAAAAVGAVVLSPKCVDPYNPKALRGGMGAHFRVPVLEMGWTQIARYCEGMRVYLADGGGTLRYDAVNWSQDWALVIGSEGHGAGEAAAKLADAVVSIPLASDTESLNAAVAAAVILFEARRQVNPP